MEEVLPMVMVAQHGELDLLELGAKEDLALEDPEDLSLHLEVQGLVVPEWVLIISKVVQVDTKVVQVGVVRVVTCSKEEVRSQVYQVKMKDLLGRKEKEVQVDLDRIIIRTFLH